MNYKKIIGKFGEDVAEQYLIKKGYKIIARNKNISHQEIDIIANFKGKIVFFEVKTRTNFSSGYAEEAIDKRKMDNIRRGILGFTIINKTDLDDAQFDVIVVNIDKVRKVANIKHYIKIF